MDAVTADLNIYEIRQSKAGQQAQRRADWIQAEVIKSEFQCTSFVIGDLYDDDEEFANDLCIALARIVRDPKSLRGTHDILAAFDRAIERKAASEWEEREAA